MVRIRYTENNGVLRSKPILANTELVEVVIDTVANSFSIHTVSEGDPRASGNAVDTNVLKKKAKAALKTLGVVFDDEVRNRSKSANADSPVIL